VPTIKVRAKKKVKLGKPLKIRWKPKVTGGIDAISGYDVLLSRDGGATFFELLATGVPAATRKLKWTASGAATETATVQVVVWTKALQRASGTSRTVRILP
jgi:hypothetical protein